MTYYYEEQESNYNLPKRSAAPVSAISSKITAPIDTTVNNDTNIGEDNHTWSEAAYTAFSENFKEGISTGWKLGVAGYEYAKSFFWDQPFLTQEQYEKSQYKIEGKSYPSGIYENIAKMRYEEYQDKIRREKVLSKLYTEYPKTTAIASFAGGMSGAILDPVFVAATTLCPPAGAAATTARMAGLTKWGVIAVKDISMGLKIGAIGGIEHYAKGKAYDEDVAASDILLSSFYGGAFGAGVTAVRGVVSGISASVQGLKNIYFTSGKFVSPQSNLAIKTRAISQLEEGKQVDITPYFKAAAFEEKYTTESLENITKAKAQHITEFKNKAEKWQRLEVLENEFRAKSSQNSGFLEKLDSLNIRDAEIEVKKFNLSETEKADAKTLEEILELRKEYANDISNITDYEHLEAIASSNIPPPAFEEFIVAEKAEKDRAPKTKSVKAEQLPLTKEPKKSQEAYPPPSQNQQNKQNQFEESIENFVRDYALNNKRKLPESLQAFLAGATGRGVKSRDSVAAYVKARKNDTLLTFWEELKKRDAADYFASKNPNNEIEIAKALRGEFTEDKLATQVAEAFKPLQEEMRETINRLGGNITVKEGYITHFDHDPIKAGYTHETPFERLQHRFSNPFVGEEEINKKAFKRWKDTHLPLLDHEKTFGNMGVKEQETALRNMYNRITARERYKNAEFGIAERWSRSQFFVYKDAESFIKANRIYGQGNIFDAMTNTLRGESQTIALAEKFGLSPKETFENVLERLKRTEGLTPSDIKKLERQRLVFDNVVGTSPYNTSSVITNNLLTWEYLTKAANITIASLNDVVHQAAVQQKLFGKSAIGAFLNTVRTQPKEFIKVLAESIGKDSITRKDLSVTAELARVMALDLHSRYHEAPVNTNRAINKLTQIMNAASGINAWDTASIRHATICTARELFLNSRNSFEKLNSDLQKTLLQYGIEKKDWDLIRKNPFRDKNGRGYITVDTANYSKTSVAEYLDKDISKVTQKDVEEVTRKARFKLLTMNQDIVDFFRLYPDAVERSLPLMRDKDFLTRTFMQFKGYPVALTRRVLSLVMENSITGFKENGFGGLLKGVAKDAIPVATYIGEGVALGYVTNSLLRLTQGKAPLDPHEPDTWKKAAVYSGVGGLYSTALEHLTSSHGSFNSDLLASLAGPVWADINNLGQVITKATSSKKVAQNNLYKLISGNIPLVNLPYTKEAFNYLIGWRMFETMAPNAFRKMVKKEKGNWLIDPRDYFGS